MTRLAFPHFDSTFECASVGEGGATFAANAQRARGADTINRASKQDAICHHIFAPKTPAVASLGYG